MQCTVPGHPDEWSGAVSNSPTHLHVQTSSVLPKLHLEPGPGTSIKTPKVTVAWRPAWASCTYLSRSERHLGWEKGALWSAATDNIRAFARKSSKLEKRRLVRLSDCHY